MTALGLLVSASSTLLLSRPILFARLVSGEFCTEFWGRFGNRWVLWLARVAARGREVPSPSWWCQTACTWNRRGSPSLCLYSELIPAGAELGSYQEPKMTAGSWKRYRQYKNADQKRKKVKWTKSMGIQVSLLPSVDQITSLWDCCSIVSLGV